MQVELLVATHGILAQKYIVYAEIKKASELAEDPNAEDPYVPIPLTSTTPGSMRLYPVPNFDDAT